MTTDRTILPDDWEEKTPQEEYDFWSHEYQAYCDILSDKAGTIRKQLQEQHEATQATHP